MDNMAVGGGSGSNPFGSSPGPSAEVKADGPLEEILVSKNWKARKGPQGSFEYYTWFGGHALLRGWVGDGVESQESRVRNAAYKKLTTEFKMAEDEKSKVYSKYTSFFKKVARVLGGYQPDVSGYYIHALASIVMRTHPNGFLIRIPQNMLRQACAMLMDTNPAAQAEATEAIKVLALPCFNRGLGWVRSESGGKGWGSKMGRLRERRTERREEGKGERGGGVSLWLRTREGKIVQFWAA
eukprot:48534-Amorphochlora_amoeboformis.AAC.3